MPDFPGYAVKSGEDMPVLYHAAADACPQRYHKHAFGALARAVCIFAEGCNACVIADADRSQLQYFFRFFAKRDIPPADVDRTMQDTVLRYGTGRGDAYAQYVCPADAAFRKAAFQSCFHIPQKPVR